MRWSYPGPGRRYVDHVPARPRKAEPPRSFIARGTWPHGRLRATAPVEARYAQVIAQRLERVLEAQAITLREAGRRTGVDRQTITRTLSGDTIADLATIAMLETGLGARLWPDEII